MTVHLWQSTLFASLAGLLTLTLRNNRARVRHAVWLAAACKFLLPFSLLIAFGGHFAWRTAPSIAPTRFATNEIVQRLPALEAASALPAEPAPSGFNSEAAIPTLVLAIWACGFMVIAVSWFVRWRRIQAVVRAGLRMDLELPIPAISSPTLLEPGIFGIFRPTLLLPEGITDSLSPTQLQAVIQHELCHVRHRDNLVAAIQMSVETLFWFHPLVWWIGKRMIAERERACDEEVLGLGIQPRVYAEGILRVCRLYTESPLACVAGVTGSDLKKRIQGIVSEKVGRDLTRIKKAGLLTTGAACLTLPVLIGVWNAPPMRGATSVSVHAIPEPTVKFRSITITPCTKQWIGWVASPSPGRLELTCEGIMGLIRLAWLNSEQPFASLDETNNLAAEAITGDDPAIWSGLVNPRFNIDARADPGTSLEAMEGPMLQALLENRYHLKIHRETRNVAAFALTVAKGGPKLKPSNAASCDGKWPYNAPPPPPPGSGARSQCVSFVGPLGKGETLESQAVSLRDFCQLLSRSLGTPVVDKTGIGGKFDIHLAFATNQTPALLAPLYPSLADEVEKQLGLKLERITQPRNFLVIDHAEKPIVN